MKPHQKGQFQQGWQAGYADGRQDYDLNHRRHPYLPPKGDADFWHRGYHTGYCQGYQPAAKTNQPDPSPRTQAGRGRPPALNPEQIAEMQQQWQQGASRSQLAVEYGVSRHTVYRYTAAAL